VLRIAIVEATPPARRRCYIGFGRFGQLPLARGLLRKILTGSRQGSG
jgi:hypothetical protein